MESTQMAESIPPRKRRRPALSCLRCRQRKLKCDRKAPCDRCTLSKRPEACSYVDDAPSAPKARPVRLEHRPISHGFGGVHEPVASLSTLKPVSEHQGEHGTTSESHVQMLEDRIQKLERLLGSTDKGQPSADMAPQEGSRGGKNPEALGTGTHFGALALEYLLPDDGTPVELALELPSKSHIDSDLDLATWGGLPHKFHELRGTFSKTRFFGQSSWINLIEEFYLVDYLKRLLESISQTIQDQGRNISTADQEIKDLFGLVQQCKNIAREAKALRPIQPFSLPDFKNTIPSREISDQLVGHYLKTFESCYRILHIPSFEREYAQYWRDPQSAGTGFVIKLLLVMAIGTCFYQGDDTARDTCRSLSRQWIHGAQCWLSGPSEKSRLNLTWLQVQCLLLLARQTNAIEGDLIWISAGSVVRMAMQMGFHLDPKHFPKMSVFYAELRRRLWATVLEMSVQSALDSGMQPMIALHDYDCAPPSNIDDTDIDENTKVAPVPKPSTTHTQTSLQILLLRSLPIRLETTRLVNNALSAPSYDDVIRLDVSLSKACREGAHFTQSHISSPSAFDDVTSPTEFHRILLDLLTRRFLHSLHRPFATKAKSDPRYYFSRKVCLESAMIFSSYVGEMPPACATGDSASELLRGLDDFTRLALVAGGCFKNVIFHDGNSTIFLELATQLEEEVGALNPIRPVTIISPPASMPSTPSVLTHKTSPLLHLSRSARAPLIQVLNQALLLAHQRIFLGETNVKGHLFFSGLQAQIKAMDNGKSAKELDEAIFAAARDSTRTTYALLKAHLSKQNEKTTMTDDSGTGDLDGAFTGQDVQETSGDFPGFDMQMQDDPMQMPLPNLNSWLFTGWDDNVSWL